MNDATAQSGVERDRSLAEELRSLVAPVTPRPVRARDAAVAIRGRTGARWIGIIGRYELLADALVAIWAS